MAKARAFAPGHISGFFSVFDAHPDSSRRGSRGGGVCIQKGARSTVEIFEGRNVEIYINGQLEAAPVTRIALDRILGGRVLGARVDIELDLPQGQGFGMSAAGTLSTCVAAKEALESMDLEPGADPVLCAHSAEVTLRSGMGDVIAQSMGGIVSREREGIPPFGIAKKGKEVGQDIVVCIVGEPISTKDVLSDPDKMMEVNSAGIEYVPIFAEHMKLDILIELSHRFAENSGLMTPEVSAALASIEAHGVGSMIMLGNAVFATGDTEALMETLAEHGETFKVIVAEQGAKVVGTAIDVATEDAVEGVDAHGSDIGLKIKGNETPDTSEDGMKIKAPVREEGEDLRVKASLGVERDDGLKLKEEEHSGKVVDIFGDETVAGASEHVPTHSEIMNNLDEAEALKRLMVIPGVGQLKAKALFDAGFRTIFQINSSGADDLAVVPKIGKRSAEKIKNALDNEDIQALQATEVANILFEEEQECELCGTILSVYDTECYECGHVAASGDGGAGDLSALAVYDSKLKADPHDADIMFAKGATLARMGRYKEALEAYWGVEREIPHFDGLYNAMAEAYGQLGLQDKAAEYYRKAISDMVTREMEDLGLDLGLDDELLGATDKPTSNTEDILGDIIEDISDPTGVDPEEEPKDDTIEEEQE